MYLVHSKDGKSNYYLDGYHAYRVKDQFFVMPENYWNCN